MKRVDFENGRTFTNILATAIPMLVAQIINLLYNIVARISNIGTVALGAVGLCFPLIILTTAFTNMFGSGHCNGYIPRTVSPLRTWIFLWKKMFLQS